MAQEATVLSPDAWLAEGAKGSGITTEELDVMAKNYQKAYDEWEVVKKEATRLHGIQEELEGKFVEALELAGKRKYYVEGIGTFSFRDQMVVTTPKNIDAKKKFLTYLRKKFGETFYLDKVSVNHQSLQKIYNDTFEAHVEEYTNKGVEVPDFHMPGLEAPTNRRSLTLRKDKE
jgi:hypothetical protein